MPYEIGFCGKSSRVALLAVPAVILASAAGCAINQRGGEEVAAALQRYEGESTAQGAAYVSAPAPAVTPAAPAPPSTTLREFILLALERNPDIQAATELARSRAERIAQVTALPDPMLMTKTLPEPTRTAEGDSFFILGVQQKFPVPEKLDRRGRIALEETRAALQQVEQTRLRVIADVKRAYYQLYVVDRTTRVIEDNQRILKGLVEVTQGQVAAGRSQQDTLRAQVELSNLTSQLLDLRQRRVTAEAMLNTLMDRNPTTSIATPAEFGVRQAELKIERLFTLAADATPELAGIEHEIERDRQALRLAKLAYWPDFTLGFEWMPMNPRDAFEPPINPATGMRPPSPQLSEDGSDNWAVVFGFNLPIWFHKIEAGIREARFKLGATRRRHAATRNKINFRITDALERVRAQRELALLFDTTIIPQARQAYEVSRASYMVGKSDFQYVIDNWQKWLKFTIQYHRSIGEIERSVATLEQAIGLSLTEVKGTSSAAP